MIQSLKYFVFMTLVLGLAYPLAMTSLAKGLFPNQAGGSLIRVGDKIVGSELIAQAFKDPKYFWPRPSAVDYNPLSSGASNLGATNADLREKVDERAKQGAKFDLLYASGSGLDPDISPDAAYSQVERIALARGFDAQAQESLRRVVEKNVQGRQFGILGEPRVNVLRLNLELQSL